MIDQLPGQLVYHFAISILLTTVVSRVILTWYRRAVTRSMRIAGNAPAEADPWFERELAQWRPTIPARPQEREAGGTFAAERRLFRRVAVIYGLGGLAAGAVMTGLFLLALGDGLRPVRTIVTFYVFCWPIVPTLSFLLVLSRWRALLAFAAYVAAGLLMTVILSAVVRYALGWTDSFPLQNAVTFLHFLAIQAWLPFLIILATSGRHIRSVAPLVLAGLLVFSFSNLAVGYALIVAMDFAAVRRVVLSWNAIAGYNGWYMLAALPIGYACWQGLRWLGRHYERKAFSDAQLLVDAWWLIVIFNFSTLLASDLGWGGLLGLTAFVTYRAVVAVGLARWQRGDARLGNRRLLLLRVFGFQRRTERLFDTVGQRWRWLGNVRMIAGADLATRIIGPGDLISFVGGRLGQLFLRRNRAFFQRLGGLDEARDPDGRYRVNKVYCHRDSWQPALQKLLTTTDFVLMDLRGFSDENQGCLFELQQIVEQDLVRHTVFVVDGTTDTKLLKTVLSDQTWASRAAGEQDAMPVNLVFARSGSAADTDKVYGALRALLGLKDVRVSGTQAASVGGPGTPPIEPALPQSASDPIRDGSTDRSGTPGVTVGIFERRTGIDPVVGWLVCVKGTNKGRDYRLHSDLNKLGRAPNMDVCIEGDEGISRENHCQIAFSPRSKTFNVIPGDGRNLSYLNDQDVLSAMRLQAYDRLDLGESSFIFIPFEFDWGTSVRTGTTPSQPEPDPEADEPPPSYPRPGLEPAVEGWGFKPVEPPPIRSVSTDAEALARIGPAAVAAVRQKSAEAARTMNLVAPDAEPVDAAVFSPQRVAKDSVFLIQVFLYPLGAEDKVDEQARKMDAVAERRGTHSLPFDLPRNTRVDLRLEMPNLTVNEADAILIWRGKPTAAQFEVTVPAAAPGTEAIGRIRFAVAGVPAGTLRFKIALAAAGSAVERGALRDVEAVRYRRAFVSYSMQDRAEVLRRVQAFRIAGLSIFQDILDLEPGERWAQALYREIDKCDVFLLFWSSAAAASDWVAKEIAYALARKAGNEDLPPAIQPVPIEGPPPPPPPKTLGHLHFNDALLAHIQAATTPRI